jgi:hypothetical protein
MPFILEGIVTTRNENGTINVAPMGPIVDPAELPRISRLLLRPFQTSTTCGNLTRTHHGVFHVVDDVLLLAQAAIGRLDAAPHTVPATVVDGEVLADACRWYEFRIESVDDSSARAELQAVVVHTGRLRDYAGLNRARHAVLEAAILATRVHFLSRDGILTRLDALRSPVEKTAGPREREAFDLICSYIDEFNQTD